MKHLEVRKPKWRHLRGAVLTLIGCVGLGCPLLTPKLELIQATAGATVCLEDQIEITHSANAYYQRTWTARCIERTYDCHTSDNTICKRRR